MLVLCLKSLEAEQMPCICILWRHKLHSHSSRLITRNCMWIRYPAVDRKAMLSGFCPRLVVLGVLTVPYDIIHLKILLKLTHAAISPNKFYESCQYKILTSYEESVWRPFLVISCCRNHCLILLKIFFVIEISPRVWVSIILLCTVLFIIHSTFQQYLFCLYQPNYITVNQFFCPSRVVICVVNINS